MKFWQNILNKLKENQRVYLLTVIDNLGSSPGRKGFKMMVAEDGFIFGSIGGGIMEFEMVEATKKLFLKSALPILFKKLIHKGRIENGSGMICSGEQIVVFHPLNKTHLSIITELLNCLAKNEKITIQFSPASFAIADKMIVNKYQNKINSDEDWYFKEQIGFKETLYIIGGGHVSLAVSEIFYHLGFYIVLLDNRSSLNTFESNSFTHKKKVIDYEEIATYIKQGNDIFVAIMTNKYTDDKLVLSKIIRKKVKYIGVLGSKSKLKTMYEVMQKDGFTAKELKKVYAPIGLKIKSETPHEIAISIAAQIIKVKNNTR